MSTFDNNVAMLRAMIPDYEPGEPYTTGYFEADGVTLSADVISGLPPNYIWVHLPGNRAKTPALNLAVPFAPGIPVTCAINRRTGIREVVRADAERATQALGYAAPAFNAPTRNAEVNTDSLPVSNLSDLRVRPKDSANSLEVTVEAGLTAAGYKYTSTHLVSAYLPSTVGTRWWVLCYLDDTNAVQFSTTGSVEMTMELASFRLPSADLDAMIAALAVGSTPLGAFTLAQDQTIISYTTSVFREARIHFNTVGDTSSTVPEFGAAVIKTLSSGVATLGTDRHIVLAAESGTSDDCTGLAGLAVGDEAWLFADAGDTITLKNNGGASDEFQFYNAADIALTGDQGLKVFKRASGVIVNSADEDTGGGGSLGDYILLREEQAANTSAGTFTSGAWRTRAVNTEVVDTGNHCTLASNEFTLAAGTYRYKASAPAYTVVRHQVRLYDVTGAAMVANGEGTSEISMAVTGGGIQTRSWVIGRFTIGASNVFRLEHRCESTVATVGMGLASNFSIDEIYAVVELWKEA